MKKPNKPSRKEPSSPPPPVRQAPKDTPPVVSAIFRNTRLQGIVVFLSAFLLYANTLGHEWAHDDTVVITENMFTQQGFAGIADIFTKDTFFGYFKEEGKAAVVSGGRYRPLTVAMFAVVYEFFGKTPAPYHLLAVLLFALTCLLLYHTLLLLLRSYRQTGYAEITSWMAAMFFVVHPVHTEAVANVKGCDEIVTLLFSLGSLVLSFKAFDTGKTGYAVAAGFSLFLGLLAKENAVTFLAVVPLALYVFRNAGMRRTVALGAPLLVAFVAFFAMRSSVLPQLFSEAPMELMNNPYIKWTGDQWIPITSSEKYATIVYTLGQYLRLLFFPLVLTHDYYPRHIGIMQWGDPAVWGSLLLYVLAGGYAVWGLVRGKHDVVVFGILYYFLTLSIVSNLVFPIGTNMGERFLFMPSVGFCLVAAHFFQKLHAANKALMWSLFFIAAALLAIRTFTRNPVWHDNKTLARTDVSTSANSAKVHSFCGLHDCTDGIEAKDPAEKNRFLLRSVEHNSKAIEIHPTFKSALLNRSVAYYHLKKYDEAISDARRVLVLVPDDKKGKKNLSLALCGKGGIAAANPNEFPIALQLLNEAVTVDSTNEEATWHLGMVYGKSNRLPEAVRWMKRFTDMRPTDPAAWDGLAWA